jgi:hypothetical protein
MPLARSGCTGPAVPIAGSANARSLLRPAGRHKLNFSHARTCVRAPVWPLLVKLALYYFRFKP